jgi:hypothetical protein
MKSEATPFLHRSLQFLIKSLSGRISISLTVVLLGSVPFVYILFVCFILLCTGVMYVLSRQYGILNIWHLCRPPQPITGIVFFYYFYFFIYLDLVFQFLHSRFKSVVDCAIQCSVHTDVQCGDVAVYVWTQTVGYRRNKWTGILFSDLLLVHIYFRIFSHLL